MIPIPAGDVFAGWIFEALNFIQMMMVELFPEWLKGIAYLGVINQPSAPRRIRRLREVGL